MSLSSLFSLFFPHLVGLDISGAFRHGRTVHITAATTTRAARCPTCATPSGRVHSHYERRLTDTPASGQETLIHLYVRKFFCDHTACEQKIFAEQVPGLTHRYARRTPRLTELLTHLALALGGRAGARLTTRLAAAVSRMTLLRLIRATPDPEPDVPHVLGVDDFALLKGHVYGTLLVDVDTHRPVDLLETRTAAALQNWLAARPGVEVICRDRAGCYADGATQGAPNAVQVADRWHLWKNLAEAVERVVARHRERLGHRRPPATTDPHPDGPAGEPVDRRPSPPRQGWIAQRTRQRHAAVHDLLSQGKTIMEIAGRLGLARNTVRRFARAATTEELLARDGTGKRPTLLQPFDPYLRQRFMEGCTNAAALWREIRAQGYRGGCTSVRDHIRPWRAAAPDREPRPERLTVRQVTAWITRHPDALDEDQRVALTDVLSRCPELERLRCHVAGFAQLMADRRGHELEGWMRAAREAKIAELDSFISGLRRDLDAVRAGLTLPYSSGVVEGHVNRLKMLKRQMYGRAKPDLLRKRVLLAA